MVMASLIMKLPASLRVLPVMFGAILIHISLGTYHTFGNMLPYMASYMRKYTDASITSEEMVWIPTLQGCFPFAMVIGGAMAARFGPRSAAFIGCSIMSSGVYLSSYTIDISLVAFVFTYGLMFGIGQGIAYVVAVSTVINWAPEKVGLVSGFVAAGFGVSSSIFAPIQTTLINPWNYAPEASGYFPQEELLKKVPVVFRILSCFYALMQFVGLLFICDPPNPGTATSVRERSQSRGSDEEEESGDESSQDSHRPDKLSMNPSEVLRSTTFYALFAALFCCSFYANTFYNLYKTFALTFIDDDMFLAAAFSVGSVANAIARIGWGQLTDRTSFQSSLSIACCLACSLLLSLPLCPLGGKSFFLLWLTLLFICMAATHALFITATVKCFGPRHKATNYGFLCLSTTVSGVLLSLLSQYLLQAIGYNWLFLITASFPFTAFVITANIQNTSQGHRITR